MTEEQNDEKKPCVKEPEPQAAPPAPRWRPASEPTCCGSGCEDCPF